MLSPTALRTASRRSMSARSSVPKFMPTFILTLGKPMSTYPVCSSTSSSTV